MCELLDRLVAELETLRDLAAAGRVLASGKIAGQRGLIAIFDIESRTALAQVLERLPLASYFSRVEVVALVSLEQALATARRSRDAGRATPPDSQCLA